MVGELREYVRAIPKDQEVWTICASGHRAALAASLLDAADIPVRLVSRGGVSEWLAKAESAQKADQPVRETS